METSSDALFFLTGFFPSFEELLLLLLLLSRVSRV